MPKPKVTTPVVMIGGAAEPRRHEPLKFRASLEEMLEASTKSLKKHVKPLTPLPVGDISGTATEAGFSYFGLFQECPRAWFLKYAMRLQPPQTLERYESRFLGTLYHAELLNHWTPEAKRLLLIFPELAEQAKEYATARKKLQPPLPDPKKVVFVEKTFTLLDGRMTSAPDMVELDAGKQIPRDFKTASKFGQSDVKRWETMPSVIAEIIALGAPHGIVDVLVKTKEPRVEQVIVYGSAEKARLFKADLEQTRIELERRWEGYCDETSEAHLTDNQNALEAFPPRLRSCAGQWGRACDFYDYCHGSEVTRAGYVVVKTEPTKKTKAKKKAAKKTKEKRA